MKQDSKIIIPDQFLQNIISKLTPLSHLEKTKHQSLSHN